MITLTAAEARRRFGELAELVQRAPVQITRNGRSCYFLVSSDEFARLNAEQESHRANPERSNWVLELRKDIEANQAGEDLALPEREKLGPPKAEFSGAFDE